MQVSHPPPLISKYLYISYPFAKYLLERYAVKNNALVLAKKFRNAINPQIILKKMPFLTPLLPIQKFKNLSSKICSSLMDHKGDELKTSPYSRRFILTYQAPVASEARDASGNRSESSQALNVDNVPLTAKCWL